VAALATAGRGRASPTRGGARAAAAGAGASVPLVHSSRHIGPSVVCYLLRQCAVASGISYLRIYYDNTTRTRSCGGMGQGPAAPVSRQRGGHRHGARVAALATAGRGSPPPHQGRRTCDGGRCRCFRSTSAQQQANPAFSRVLSAPPVRSSKRNLVFAHL
jgi:hypothetical protein